MALHFKCTTSLHFLRVPQFLLSDPSPTLRSRLRHSENSFPQTMLGPIGALQAARKLLKSQQKYALSCLLSASNIKDFGPLKLTEGGNPNNCLFVLEETKKIVCSQFWTNIFWILWHDLVFTFLPVDWLVVGEELEEEVEELKTGREKLGGGR